MRLVYSIAHDAAVVSINGTVRREETGRLLDALVEVVRESRRDLVIDLSELDQVSRAGLRGLVVAAKLLQQAGRRMRICHAPAPVELMLQHLGYAHLLKIDATLDDSLAALGRGRRPTAPAARPANTDTAAARPVLAVISGR